MIKDKNYPCKKCVIEKEKAKDLIELRKQGKLEKDFNITIPLCIDCFKIATRVIN